MADEKNTADKGLGRLVAALRMGQDIGGAKTPVKGLGWHPKARKGYALKLWADRKGNSEPNPGVS